MRAVKAVGIALLLICSAYCVDGTESAQATAAKHVYDHLEDTHYKVLSEYKEAPEDVSVEMRETIESLIEQSKLAKHGYKISMVVSSKFASRNLK